MICYDNDEIGYDNDDKDHDKDDDDDTLGDAERSCSTQGGQIAQLNPEQCALPPPSPPATLTSPLLPQRVRYCTCRMRV